MKDYKRKNYLINPGFQIKVSLYIVICIFVSTIFYPIGIWQIFYHFGMEISKYDPTILTQLVEKRTDIFIVLALWEIGVLALVFVMCIFISHRVAGPLHKLKIYLKELSENQQAPKLIFRKGDYFPEIADIWNESFSKIENLDSFGKESIISIVKELENLKADIGEGHKKKIEEIIQKAKNLQK